MPTDRRWSDADRELVVNAIYGPADHPAPTAETNQLGGRLERKAAAVLDALTADGWRPAAGAALDKHLALRDARVQAEVAERLHRLLLRIADHLHTTGQQLPDKTTAELLEAILDATTEEDTDA